MDKHTIRIRCKNTGKSIECNVGSTLAEIYQQAGISMEFGPIVARVNNTTRSMDRHIYHESDIEFLDMHESTAQRTYMRSMFMVLAKAVKDIMGQDVMIDVPVSGGYYCHVRHNHGIADDVVARIRQRITELIAQNIPFRRMRIPSEEAIKLFEEQGMDCKAKLLRSIGKIYTTHYDLDGYRDFYYGAMLQHTGQIYLFSIEKYYEGLLLRIPTPKNPAEVAPLVRQDKMFEVFQEHHHWQDLVGVTTIGDFNEKIDMGYAKTIINVSEALQEKKLAQIADAVQKKGAKMVLIAGPSSSGKTTSSKRLSIQLLACGIKPHPISLDDYYVNRVDTPLDETGKDYDYESLYALNIPLLNEHLKALFEGKEVELPRYDFTTGESILNTGNFLKLGDNDVLVVEGIHALNPELTAQVPDELKYKVYASALTSILLDRHNYIPTTDNRLLRRIIRDTKYRNCPARETIRRWPSVRRGEDKWIFPYQENCDTMFNTAMLYELAVIKQQAEPALRQVPENCPEYPEAYRLLKFLSYIKPLDSDILPPASLLREFIGGSVF